MAWAIVLLAFFVLSVQLFITIIEFKLTTLAGFVLVPFALFGKTAFLAERVLGNVITAGIKLMVLAIVVGIGSTLFGEIAVPPTGDINLRHAASVILAAIAVFGLAIFVPGIAAGLVSGAPQLGAGAAAGTAIGVAGAGLATGMAARGAATMATGTAGGAVPCRSVSGRTHISRLRKRRVWPVYPGPPSARPLAVPASRMTTPARDAFRSGQAEGFSATQSSGGNVGPWRWRCLRQPVRTAPPGPGRCTAASRCARPARSPCTACATATGGGHGEGPRLDPDR